MMTKKKQKKYWTTIHEKAVVDYLKLEPESKEAEKIFNEILYPALRKLVENIMFTYKLSIPSIPIDDQINDCLSFILLKFRKFNPEKGHMAFSYFGTIAKNYQILQQNREYKRKLFLPGIEDVINMEFEMDFYVDHEFESSLNSNEFLLLVIAENLSEYLSSEEPIPPNVYKLGELIVYLLKNYSAVNVYSKNQFYLIAKEFTGLSTKEITKALQTLKDQFKITLKDVYN